MKKKVDLPEFDINDPEVIKDLYRHVFPVGSGPLGLMRICSGLLWAIAQEKGIELQNPPEGDTKP